MPANSFLWRMIRKLPRSTIEYEVWSTHQYSVVRKIKMPETMTSTGITLWELKLMGSQGGASRLQRGKVEVTLFLSVQAGVRDRSCARCNPQDVYIQLRFGQKIFDPSLRCAKRSASGGIARKSERWSSGYSESPPPGHKSRSRCDASQSRPLSWFLLNLAKMLSSSIWGKERPKPWYNRRTTSNCMTSTMFK